MSDISCFASHHLISCVCRISNAKQDKRGVIFSIFCPIYCDIVLRDTVFVCLLYCASLSARKLLLNYSKSWLLVCFLGIKVEKCIKSYGLRACSLCWSHFIASSEWSLVAQCLHCNTMSAWIQCNLKMYSYRNGVSYSSLLNLECYEGWTVREMNYHYHCDTMASLCFGHRWRDMIMMPLHLHLVSLFSPSQFQVNYKSDNPSCIVL